jgi:hypothetical protein
MDRRVRCARRDRGTAAGGRGKGRGGGKGSRAASEAPARQRLEAKRPSSSAGGEADRAAKQRRLERFSTAPTPPLAPPCPVKDLGKGKGDGTHSETASDAREPVLPAPQAQPSAMAQRGGGSDRGGGGKADEGSVTGGGDGEGSAAAAQVTKPTYAAVVASPTQSQAQGDGAPAASLMPAAGKAATVSVADSPPAACDARHTSEHGGSVVAVSAAPAAVVDTGESLNELRKALQALGCDTTGGRSALKARLADVAALETAGNAAAQLRQPTVRLQNAPPTPALAPRGFTHVSDGASPRPSPRVPCGAT